MKQQWKIVCTIVGTIVLLFFILAGIASPIGKYIVNHHLESVLGRAMHADRVHINIYNGDVTVYQWGVKEPNGETEFIHADKLYIQISYPRLIAKRVKINHIHIDGFTGQILQGKENFNFSDIIHHFTSTPKSDSITDKSDKWHVLLHDIMINNSTIHYTDVVHDRQWRINDINFTIPGIDLDNAKTNAGLRFAIPTGGAVSIQASFNPDNTNYTILLALDSVHTDAALPLIQDYIDVSTLGARIQGKLYVNGRTDNIDDIRIYGTLGMHGLSVIDADANKIASVDAMRLAINRMDIRNRTFILDTLALSGVTGTYTMHKDGNTISRLWKKHSEQEAPNAKKAKQANTSAQTKPIVWKAKYASITGHELVFADRSMKKEWEYSIRDIRIEGRNVSSNGRNKLLIHASLPHNARLEIDYTGGLDYKAMNTHFDLQVTHLDLRDMDIACRNYTGYGIESGLLYMKSHMDITSGILTGTTSIMIEQAKVGKKERLSRAPYRNLPIRSTVKMLSDKEGRITIDAPIKADVRKRNFTIANAISKSLLRSAFGRMMVSKKGKRDRSISKDEWAEMEQILSDTTQL